MPFLWSFGHFQGAPRSDVLKQFLPENIPEAVHFLRQMQKGSNGMFVLHTRPYRSFKIKTARSN